MARTDTERIDWLQSHAHGYGGGWMLRNSTDGRGLRLHETELPGATPDVRAAIDRFIDEQEGR
jgi:hypothetical protein